MRLLGKISDPAEARLLYGLFASRKIGCRVEPAGGGWEVWALDEDQMVEARTLFHQFLADPCKEQYAPLALAAEEAAAAAELARRRAAAAEGRRPPLTEREFMARPAPASWAVIGICAALWLLQTIAPGVFLVPLHDLLQIGPPGGGVEGALARIAHGEVWRLFTPALLHAPVTLPDGETQLLGILHIFFNLLWMKDLGPLIERRHGSGYLLAMLLVVAAASNLAQLFATGPNFVGLSGVVYGLLGFLWLRGRMDPRYGLRLNPGIVQFMLLWLVLCMFMGGVANACHVAGLAAGCLWGAVSARLAAGRG